MFHALKDGARVNFERSLKFGDEVGGHVLSGHVDVVAELVNVEKLHESKIVTFKVSPEWTKYLFTKGYIAVQGASLTLTGVNKDQGLFTISLIPETLAKTTFGEMRVGVLVNIEIDRTTQVVVDTVERMIRDAER
jgi:riboflavin synthase